MNYAKYVSGYGPIASIINFFSSGGVSYTASSLVGTASNGCKELLSGALTANTLATVLNLSGRGRLNLLTAYAKDTTSRTVRCKIIIDGTTIFDATSNAITTVGGGLVPIGAIDAGGAVQQFGQIVYYSSCVVQVASSLTETDKVGVGANYETWA